MKSNIYSLLLPCVLLLWFAGPSSAQNTNPEADSLKRLLDAYPEKNAERINRLEAISFNLQQTNPKLAFQYAQECHRLSVELDNKRGISEALGQMSNYYFLTGQHDSVVILVNQQLELDSINGFKETTSYAYQALGSVETAKYNYLKGYDFYQKALEYVIHVKKEKRAFQKATLIGCIGDNFYELGYYDAAIDSLTGSNRILLGLPQTNEVVAMVNNNYNSLGANNYAIGNIDEAMTYYQKALPYFIHKNHTIAIGVTYHNFSEVFFLKNQLDSAAFYHEKAINLLHNNFDKVEAESFLIGAELAIAKQDYGKALESYNTAIQIFERSNYKKYEASALIKKANFLLGYKNDNIAAKEALTKAEAILNAAEEPPLLELVQLYASLTDYALVVGDRKAVITYREQHKLYQSKLLGTQRQLAAQLANKRYAKEIAELNQELKLKQARYYRNMLVFWGVAIIAALIASLLWLRQRNKQVKVQAELNRLEAVELAKELHKQGLELDKLKLVNTMPAPAEVTFGRTTLQISQISHVESQGQGAIIYDKNGNVLHKISRITMQEALDKLGGQESKFLWIHRSFIVNPDSIKSKTPKNMELYGGFSIPIGKNL